MIKKIIVGAGLLLLSTNAYAAKQTLGTAVGTTHGEVRGVVNSNATKANSNFTEVYNDKANKASTVMLWSEWANGATFTTESPVVVYNGALYKCTAPYAKVNGETPDTQTDYFEEVSGGSGAVASVNGATGVVVLDADDISDAATTNKFVTSADKTKLSNLSGTNTGDQDLSSLATKANVLQLNNTTAFTPDADHEPATKKYVDDVVVGVGGYNDEAAQDAVGGMVTGNTETGISVTYEDSDGTLDFVVASQTENNFTTVLKNKLDGIAVGAQVDTDDQNASEVPVTITNFNGNLTVSENTVQKALDKIDDMPVGGSYTDENAQDAVGGMLTGNTVSSGITVAYDDATAKINITLDSDLIDLVDGSISSTKVGPPGSDTQVMFNNASAFAGDAGMTYAPATDALTVSGSISSPTFTLSGADGARKFVLPNNTSISATAGEEAIYNEGDQIKVTESGIEYDIIHSGNVGAVGGVQAYNQYLPTWPSSVSATEVGHLDGVTSAIQGQITAKENSLGNPGTNGWVLSSTAGGTRSWIAPGGMTYPLAGIPNSTGSAWGTSYTLDADLTSTSASDDTLPSAKATKTALDLKANVNANTTGTSGGITGLTLPAPTTSGQSWASTGAGVMELVEDTQASANGTSLITAANYAAMRTLLDLEAGTDFYSMSAAATAFQGANAHLTDLADGSLSASKVGSGFYVADDCTSVSTPATGAICFEY